MPQMADVVVKKNDGVTNVTYAALVPSAGDSSPARWAEPTASTIRGHRPILEVRSQYNGPRTARRVTGQFKMPALRSVSGVETKVGDIILDFSVVVPVDVEDTTVNEAIAQGTNLLVSTLIRSSLTSGYSPS